MGRTVDADVDQARETLSRLQSVGVVMTDVGQALEREGMAIFTKSFRDLLAVLDAKRASLAVR